MQVRLVSSEGARYPNAPFETELFLGRAPSQVDSRHGSHYTLVRPSLPQTMTGAAVHALGLLRSPTTHREQESWLTPVLKELLECYYQSAPSWRVQSRILPTKNSDKFAETQPINMQNVFLYPVPIENGQKGYIRFV